VPWNVVKISARCFPTFATRVVSRPRRPVSFIYRPAYYERKQEIRADDGSQGMAAAGTTVPGEYEARKPR
jgi:hypothetical protein